MAPKTVLVTGTNRGIGLEITKQFLSKGYTVISAVRSPEKQPALTPLDDARHIIVQLDIGQPETIKAAIGKIREDFGFETLDIVINNAAIGVTHQNAFMVRDAKSSEYTEAWKINFIGTLELFVSVYPMLPKNGQGKFVGISTLAAVQSMLHWPLGGAYTTSKNAVNYLVRQIHSEESELIAFTISPGWVDTDMGHEGAAVFGAADGPPEKVSVTVPQLVATIENATRDGEGGRMINYNGEPFDW